MVLQHIYGRDPIIGYCDKKCSSVLETGDIITSTAVRLNRSIINPKINYILPQYLYGDLPNCYYLIHRAGCVVYGKSSYVESGRGEYINHNYIFTNRDSACDVFSGESVFDVQNFLTRIEQAEDYDIETPVFSENNFDISVIKKTLDNLFIDRVLFEKLLFALIESACLGTRVYVIPKNMNSKFTEDILDLIKAIYYSLPRNFLPKLGFITYFSSFASLSNSLDGSIRLVCIEKNADNSLMFADIVESGNFIFQLDPSGSKAMYPDSIDTSGAAVTRLFSGAIFDGTEAGYKTIFEQADMFPQNAYLLYITYLCGQPNNTDEIEHMLKMSESFGDLFKKFEFAAKYIEADIFLEALYITSHNLLNKSNYANLTDFAANIFSILDKKSIDAESSIKLNKIVHIFVNKYMDKISGELNVGDTAAEQILQWSDRLLSYISKENCHKLSNITIYKRLKTAIQKISPDCVGIYLVADSGARKKVSHDISQLSSLYLKNSNTAKEKVFYQILPVLLDGYLPAFKLAWTKGGLQEIIRFTSESEHNSLLQDFDSDSGQLSFNEIERSLRSFFAHDQYRCVLEKSAKSDSKIKAFAKRHRLL